MEEEDYRYLEGVAVDAEQVLLHHEGAHGVAPVGGGVLERGHEEGEVGEDAPVGGAGHLATPLQQADVLPVLPDTTSMPQHLLILPQKDSQSGDTNT